MPLKSVSELMDKVGLAERLINTYPHELDGGRRQQHRHRQGAGDGAQVYRLRRTRFRPDVSIQAQILNLLKELQRDWA